MIYITGDTHGLIDTMKLKYFKNKYFSEKDVLIILGDAGIVWSEEEIEEHIRFYVSLNLIIIFIDGNHENFKLLNKFPITNMFNAKMHLIAQNIYHVMRGEIMIINDLKFLCIGGAVSIDKIYRKKGVSYWDEENISKKDIDNALINLEKHDFKVDYILTHCVDTKTVINNFGYRSDNCTDSLSFIDKLVNYKNWYFGHYHVDKVFDEKKRCFYDDILEIKKMYEGKKKVKFNSNIYTSEDYNLNGYTSIEPYLYSNFSYKTKLCETDLPEWYVHGRYYKRFGYLSSKGIKSLKYFPNMLFNHYLRDDVLRIEYEDNKIIRVDGWNIANMILAIERYSDLDLTYLKRKVNFKASYYNFYHKDDWDYKEVEPAFKEIEENVEIEQLAFRLINIINEEVSFYPKASKFFMDTYISDKIFDKSSGYYLKEIEYLINEIKKEIEIMKEREEWRYSY